MMTVDDCLECEELHDKLCQARARIHDLEIRLDENRRMAHLWLSAASTAEVERDALREACEAALARWYNDDSRGAGLAEDHEVAQLLISALRAE